MKEKHTVIRLVTGSEAEYPKNCVEQHLIDGYLEVTLGSTEIIYPVSSIISIMNYDVEVDLDDLEAPDVPCKDDLNCSNKVLADGILGRVDV